MKNTVRKNGIINKIVWINRNKQKKKQKHCNDFESKHHDTKSSTEIQETISEFTAL